MSKSDQDFTATLSESAKASQQKPMHRPLEIPRELLEKSERETEEWIKNIEEGSRRMAADPEYRRMRSEKMF